MTAVPSRSPVPSEPPSHTVQFYVQRRVALGPRASGLRQIRTYLTAEYGVDVSAVDCGRGEKGEGGTSIDCREHIVTDMGCISLLEDWRRNVTHLVQRGPTIISLPEGHIGKSRLLVMAPPILIPDHPKSTGATICTMYSSDGGSEIGGSTTPMVMLWSVSCGAHGISMGHGLRDERGPTV